MDLTKRQTEVMQRVALGMTDKEIGHDLGVSPQTIKNTLVEIYNRVEARNRANAVALVFTVHKVPLDLKAKEEPRYQRQPDERRKPDTSPNPSRPLLTARETAAFLNVHTNTVRRWADQGLLKCVYIGTRKDRRFWSYDVVRFASLPRQQ